MLRQQELLEESPCPPAKARVTPQELNGALSAADFTNVGAPFSNRYDGLRESVFIKKR